MRKKTALTIALVILGCFLGLAGLAVCGLVFLDRMIQVPQQITAEYPGISLWGRETAEGWEYEQLSVTPSDGPDANAAELAKGLLIRLGHQHPVPIREVTPEMLDNYLREEKEYSRPTPPDGKAGPGTIYMIEFRAGSVRSARYTRFDRGISFIKGEKEFRLPISRKAFESMFGKPTSIKISRGHWG